jgi:GTP-binding protein
MSKPVVAIVGRPNVGKSTLFNRLVGGRTAIVEDIPGVTRDRIYRDAEWLGRYFTLVDTGGLDFGGKDDSILGQVRKQVQVAIREAELIIFLVDGKVGPTADDEKLGEILRKSQKPVLLVVNKIEEFQNNQSLYEFYELGLGEPIPVSAANGMNIGDLLDAVIERLPRQEEEIEPDVIKIAVVGRPNVGKSSLVNAILGQERVIVSAVPGTTRDAVDTPFIREGQRYILIDTAGMRKRGSIDQSTERYSVMRSLRAIERSDVSLLLIDATLGVTEQDTKIAGYIMESGKGCIILVNKWDLIEKNDKTMREYEQKIREDLSFMAYAPILFISALTKQRVGKIAELVDFVAEQQSLRVNTSVLNEVIAEAVQVNPPPGDKGKRLKIFYCTQVAVKPPHFVLFVNLPELMHFSYQRYIENVLRKNFGFEGSPLKIGIKRRGE